MRAFVPLLLLAAACAPAREADDDSTDPTPDGPALDWSGDYEGAPVFEVVDGFWTELVTAESSLAMLVLSDRDDACVRLTAWTEAFTAAMGTAQAGDAEQAQDEINAASDDLDLLDTFWKPEFWIFRDASGLYTGERTFGEGATLYFCRQEGPPDFIGMAAGGGEDTLRRVCGYGIGGTVNIQRPAEGDALTATGTASLLGPTEQPAGDVAFDVELPFCAGYGPAYVAMLEYF